VEKECYDILTNEIAEFGGLNFFKKHFFLILSVPDSFFFKKM